MKTKKLFLALGIVAMANTFSYGQIIFSCGVKNVSTENGTIQFSYTDESPDPDTFTTDVKMKGGKSVFVFGVDLDFNTVKSKIKPLLKLQGFYGEVIGLDGGIGCGLPIRLGSNESVTLQPEITACYGYVRKELGTLINTTGYIQVNKTEYAQGKDVDVSLKDKYFALKPGLKLNVKVSPKYLISFYAGYHFELFRNTVASFNGDVSGDKSEVETEKIGAKNVLFRVNGSKTSDAPFSVGGFEFKIGFGF